MFRKGDPADELFYVESGVFSIPEVGIEIRKGGIVGELGLLSPGNTRTASLVCMQGGGRCGSRIPRSSSSTTRTRNSASTS